MQKRKRKRYAGVTTIKKGEVYQIDYYPYPGAQRKQHRVQAGSEAEASRIRAAEMTKAASEPDVKSLPFNELKEQLILKCQADENRKKTVKNLLWIFRTFFEEFLPKNYPHITSINQLSISVVEAYKNYLADTLGREKAWRNELTRLRIIIKKLIRAGCCNKRIYYDVLSGFKKPSRKKRLYKNITPSQIKKLLHYIEKDRPDYYGITYMVARLGWRREQVISLKKDNIETRGLKPIAIQCEPETTKNKEPHVLTVIDDELAKVLIKYKFNGKHKTKWLFPNKIGNKHHSSHYQMYISKVSQDVIGIRLTPHDFRHSFCTRLLGDGHNRRDIMEITGHKDVESFNIYTHPTSDGAKNVLKDSRLF